jgi:hypothetical protein
MSDLRKRLEQVVSNTNRKLIQQQQILPVKTEEGILVGAVLIKTRENQKDLYLNGKLFYEGIYLNKAAVKIANMLAVLKRSNDTMNTLYKADQEYGRVFNDSQLLRLRLHLSRQRGDHDKADIYLARYIESKNRVEYTKKQVLALAIP